MQRIDLSHTSAYEILEIALPSGTVRVQVNALINQLRSDVVQMDVNRAIAQTVTSGQDFFKVVRRLNVVFQQEQPTCCYRKPSKWRLWNR